MLIANSLLHQACTAAQLDCRFKVWSKHTFVKSVKALTKLCESAGSSENWLLANEINNSYSSGKCLYITRQPHGGVAAALGYHRMTAQFLCDLADNAQPPCRNLAADVGEAPRLLFPDEVGGILFWRRPSVRPHFLSVRNHISELNGQI